MKTIKTTELLETEKFMNKVENKMREISYIDDFFKNTPEVEKKIILKEISYLMWVYSTQEKVKSLNPKGIERNLAALYKHIKESVQILNNLKEIEYQIIFKALETSKDDEWIILSQYKDRKSFDKNNTFLEKSLPVFEKSVKLITEQNKIKIKQNREKPLFLFLAIVYEYITGEEPKCNKELENVPKGFKKFFLEIMKTIEKELKTPNESMAFRAYSYYKMDNFRQKKINFIKNYIKTGNSDAFLPKILSA